MRASAFYRGRFAPSPSGPLHLGSLVTALASFLDARANSGTWLVRIEDIDPPREMPSAAQLICESLQAHGLRWDEDILYQSTRLGAYASAVSALLDSGAAYYCTCSRQSIAQNAGGHAPECLRSTTHPAVAAAVRVTSTQRSFSFNDVVLGEVTAVNDLTAGDIVVRRKDGLYAYQLAVVADDAFQAISHVVRGRDLLDSTAAQVQLQKALGFASVTYGHLPLLLNHDKQKLSKQSFATPIDNALAAQNLLYCLDALGQLAPAEEIRHDVNAILRWAVAHWHPNRIPLQDRVHIFAPEARPERSPSSGTADHVPQ